MTKVAIIGAGCSGFTVAKRLKDESIAFDWFEASDRIGGNWAYQNPNGMSAAYQSLHIDTSKHRLAFEDFPVPGDWPDFPHHSLIADYFNRYVDHFGLRPLIRFEEPVVAVRRDGADGWRVTTRKAEANYTHVAVCNGHHWSPNMPDYPGAFDGPFLHAHDYRTSTDPVDLRGKRVVVIGLGNSAVDIASELGNRTVAEKVWVSVRRGVWVFPKYIGGRPADKTAMPAWMPPALGRKIAARMLVKAVGRMSDYGLPEPDHPPLHAHPTVSTEFLPRLGNGDILVKPAITRLDGGRVHFADGSIEAVDAIIAATGYRTEFPFLEPADAPVRDNHLPLWKRLVQPDPALHTLWFFGLAQSLPTLVNLAEQQSKLFAAWLGGRWRMPSPETMARTLAADERRNLGHFYDSPRHRMQLDFAGYVRELERELRAA